MTNLYEQGVQIHGEKDHSFFVSLEACNGCHVSQMHEPVEGYVEEDEESLDAMVDWLVWQLGLYLHPG
jgi:hypothetical protein